jgi:hypothetical protein
MLNVNVNVNDYGLPRLFRELVSLTFHTYLY